MSVATQPAKPQPTAKAEQSARPAKTIKCPLTGEQIPDCCCPVKK